MAFIHSPKIVTDGLVLYLDAANRRSYPGSGTSWFDIIGNNTATLLSGSVFNTSTLGNIAFDGIDDIVTIPYSTNIVFSGNRTTEMWVRVGSIGATFSMILVNRGSGNDPNTTFILFIDNRQVIRTWNPTGTDQMVLVYGVGNDTAPFYTFSARKMGTTNGDNQWHHIAATTNTSNTTISLYYDGQLVHSNTYTGTIATPNNNVRIGAGYDVNSTQFPMVGNVANIKIYNRVLSAQEILHNYNATRSRFGA